MDDGDGWWEESGNSMLSVRLDDDDDDEWNYTMIFTYSLILLI